MKTQAVLLAQQQYYPNPHEWMPITPRDGLFFLFGAFLVLLIWMASSKRGG
jgi:hypothetical protein